MLQEISEKNLERSWVSRVKISHPLFSIVIEMGPTDLVLL